ncbi:hypothetical protein [Halostella litorea]|uniref:hypothetical protein n=1 Tax=Halostella litorea TaxID=2528831 RepID=UPI00138662B8|nr:hypothetical protein [Halostella litorea]
MGPELWIVLMLFVVVTVPVFVGAVALVNRRTGRSRDDEIEELKERVDELESKLD